jgi:hypothetical protein
MTTRYILLCLTLLYTVALHAQGIKDVIVMKNGDRLTGEITGLSAGVFPSRCVLDAYAGV